MGKELSEALQLRYPRAFEVADSWVWECLETDRSEHWLRLRLHRGCCVSTAEIDTSDLIRQLASETRVVALDELSAIGVLICALRLAIVSNLSDAIVPLALAIARRLLLLAGCRLRVKAAGEIWRHCDIHIIRGIKHNGMYLRFAENTWDWFAAHARTIYYRCLDMAFRYPSANELAPEVMPAMLAELATGIAHPDLETTIGILSAYKRMSMTDRSIPDADEIGIWRSSLVHEMNYVPWKG
jgi:hypothetical protein